MIQIYIYKKSHFGFYVRKINNGHYINSQGVDGDVYRAKRGLHGNN